MILVESKFPKDPDPLKKNAEKVIYFYCDCLK